MTTPRVVAVAGSLRDGSYTRHALERALDAASEAGADTKLIDLREYDLPVFDPDREELRDERRLKREIREADAILLGTPVYHGTMSSALKNALDYCGSDEFEDKTVGLLAVAGGGTFGPTLVELRTAVRTVHGWTLPHEVGIRKARNHFDDDGSILDSGLEERVRKLGRLAVEFAHIEPKRVIDPQAADE